MNQCRLSCGKEQQKWLSVDLGKIVDLNKLRLLQHHGKSIKPPQRKACYPEPEFTTWHVNEVFKGGYRDL